MTTTIASKSRFYYSEERSVYMGKMNDEFVRKTGPSMLMLSLDRYIEVLDRDKRTTYWTKSLVVPSGSPIVVKTNRATVAMCFLDDAGNDLQKLIGKMQRRFVCPGGIVVHCDLNGEGNIISQAQTLWRTGESTKTVIGALKSWMSGKQSQFEEPIDTRVERAISIIRATCMKNISSYEIADAVELSLPRLAQLFKSTTGVSIRTYRLWCRMFKTAQLLEEGLSLTDAAIAAGFTDYPQCYRVYKELGGSNPSKTREQLDVKVA